ncbi:hypothetical protein FSW04_17215 [Baekduia soli]|uniref:Uncharacterized protein n=1 Tax=Baekduia soli TaxID=496014 RepID=A0A5B8U872_9ACTN|nr:hypothetical protein [Baekduia soli]QEC49145.1 hypothetical protein FSW04_17215 [Baekduia soli]
MPERPDVDYNLHGLAGVRLIDADPRDVAAVDRQLGPIRGAVDGPPDLIVRFVDRLEVRGKITLLGLDDAGFTDDAFLILRSKHKARARVQLPLEQIGTPGAEIVCERGLPAVPLLIACLNLSVLGRGALPLHAAAFVHRGVGVVVTGWSKGGKTEAVLAFMSQGAQFAGDEWIYVEPSGERVHGIPEPMRIWDWNLRQLPALGERVARGDRAKLAALRTAGSLARGRRGRRVGTLLERQRHIDVPPERLFDDAAVLLTAPFDRLMLVASCEGPETTARPIDPAEVADRMAASLDYEREPLAAAYAQFRFAFPGRRNALLEDAGRREQALLHQVFAGKPAFAVDHPYPVDLARLYDAMDPLC